MAASRHHKVVVVGGGTAGIAVAAKLRLEGETDIAVIEPSETHYYQPLYTLIGAGVAPRSAASRPQSSVMPKDVAWIKAYAQNVDPDNQVVSLSNGSDVAYDYLVVCPGIQLNFGGVSGMEEAMTTSRVSSNYLLASTADTARNIAGFQGGGTALFTQPMGPIKCAGAPQKIAYLAADTWRQKGILKDSRVVLVLPTPGMFGVKVFADALAVVAADYGIEVHLNSEVVEMDGTHAVVRNNAEGTTTTVDFDMAHVVPPQSAPDWIKGGPLADPESPFGYVEVDQSTLQHKRYANIFSLGDASSAPTSKTGAAVRHEYPVLVANMLAQMKGRSLEASYDGYSSCPLVTSRTRMLLAEFDYKLEPKPSFKFIDTTKPRRDMYYLKRYGLPFMYWNLMMKGRA